MKNIPSPAEYVALGCAVVSGVCLLFWVAVFTVCLCLVRV